LAFARRNFSLSGMKICLQERLLPGETLEERLDFAESIGVEGLEIASQTTAEDASVYEEALKGRSIRLAAICGNPTFDFLDPDPKKRRASIEQSKLNLDIVGRLGGAGQIVPPIFGPARLPDLSPLRAAVELEYQLMAEIVKELAAHAAQRNTLFLLEPLNRYEQHFLRKQADGAKLIEMAGSPEGVALLSDFFHMHIEETDTPAAIREVGALIGHVHLADNTRLEPGVGDIDWKAGLQALRDVGYEGYLSWECGLSGDKAESCRKSVAFVRETLAALD